MKNKTVLIPLILVCFAVLANADTFVTYASRAAQNPNDIFDWGQLGPDSTQVTSPASVTSFGGLNATVSIAGTKMLALVEDCQGGCGLGSWNGNFDIGESLLYTGNLGGGGPGPMTVDFATGVASVGFQIQHEPYGPFTATLQVYNGGTLLQTLVLDGDSNNHNDGSALFMGLGDLSGANITSIVISDDGVGDANDFAINALSVTTVPEPGSMALLGTGMLGLAGVFRRKLRL